MSQRIDYQKIAPNAIHGLIQIEKYLQETGMDPKIYELVKLRASQINGCAYCIDMHTKDARAGGETEQRLYSVSVWREAPYYTEKEKAALEWTEALSLISENEVSDEIYKSVRKEYNEKDLVDLTMVIVAINSWNRLAISFRTEPGTYQVK